MPWSGSHSSAGALPVQISISCLNVPEMLHSVTAPSYLLSSKTHLQGDGSFIRDTLSVFQKPLGSDYQGYQMPSLMQVRSLLFHPLTLSLWRNSALHAGSPRTWKIKSFDQTRHFKPQATPCAVNGLLSLKKCILRWSSWTEATPYIFHLGWWWSYLRY